MTKPHSSPGEAADPPAVVAWARWAEGNLDHREGAYDDVPGVGPEPPDVRALIEAYGRECHRLGEMHPQTRERGEKRVTAAKDALLRALEIDGAAPASVGRDGEGNPLHIQFVHETRNVMVPARHHVDRLLEGNVTPAQRDRLLAIRRAVVRMLAAAEDVASGASAITDRSATDAHVEPLCTGLTARWCPRCGTCACQPDPAEMSSPLCPLHAATSQHAEAGVAP